MRGVNDDELCDFAELTRERPLNVRFIEWMPFDGNVWAAPKMVPFREMVAALGARYPQGLQRLQARPRPRPPAAAEPLPAAMLRCGCRRVSDQIKHSFSGRALRCLNPTSPSSGCLSEHAPC